MHIREVRLADAEKLSALIKQIDHDSKFMLWHSGERNLTPAVQLKMIESFLNKPNSTILVAEEGDELIGYLLANGGQAKKNRHSAYLVIGVAKAYQGKGIGALLFEKLNEWALNLGVRRLELTVVTTNKSAVALYEKEGFNIEGIKKDSLFLNNS